MGYLGSLEGEQAWLGQVVITDKIQNRNDIILVSGKEPGSSGLEMEVSVERRRLRRKNWTRTDQCTVQYSTVQYSIV